MEDAIIHKVAGYANTPIGINIMRNLLVLGPLLGSMDPEVLGAGVIQKRRTARSLRNSGGA
jgi:hypothetical protein